MIDFTIPEPTYSTITLGKLVDLLSAADPEASVEYDFPNQYPCGIDSWRGVYAQLALGYGPNPVRVKDILPEIKGAIGSTFQGYKGGDYTMGRQTLVHVANCGEGGNTRIESVDISNAVGKNAGKPWSRVIIHTKYTDE